MGPVAVRCHDVPFAAQDTALDGLRIAHISDLHFRRWNDVLATASKLLASLDYDVLAATGDYAHWPRHWHKAVELMKRFFEPIAGREGLYATLGNHDHENIAGDHGLPIQFLRDESVIIERGSAKVALAGVDQLKKRGGELHKALACADGVPTVLLAHYPSTVYRLPPGRVMLQLSGHTHGGQWRLPYIGCLWGNDRIHPRYAWGLHRIGQTQLHVSAGLGTSLPLHARINCPPEITILTLRPLKCATVASPSAARPSLTCGAAR
ncbi:MAG: metallophosphoesterase [Phycisphaerales bacterium]|nr:metallophosphoesterase [Phycisphaerales bacterium]